MSRKIRRRLVFASVSTLLFACSSQKGGTGAASTSAGASGSSRAHCDACAHDVLVPFRCKGRGLCPSCCARRMSSEAASLTDRVLPNAPRRQWVLSLSFELRELAATKPDVLTALGRIFAEEMARVTKRLANIERAETGAISVPASIRSVWMASSRSMAPVELLARLAVLVPPPYSPPYPLPRRLRCPVVVARARDAQASGEPREAPRGADEDTAR